MKLRLFQTLVLTAISLGIGLLMVVEGFAAPGVHAQLPPRPTLTPTPTPLATPSATPRPMDTPVRIRLVVEPAYEGAWSLVQWQDSSGGWHAVTGWQGQISAGQKQWRVLPKDFDTGPFRWIVLDQPNGEILATSQPFTMPSRNQPLRMVTVEK